MPNNLTDAEIKKALECCTTKGASCKDCPAFVKVDRSNCKKYFRGALDLINRQEDKCKAYKHYYDECLKDLKNAHAENESLKAEVKKALNTDFSFVSARCNGKTKRIQEIVTVRIKTIKAEAYKECIEKVKDIICDNTYPYFDKDGKAVTIFKTIDGYNRINNLLNELVGDGNE